MSLDDLMIADPLTRALSPPSPSLANATTPGFGFLLSIILTTVRTSNQSVTTAKSQTPINPFGTCIWQSPHNVTRPSTFALRLPQSVPRAEPKSGRPNVFASSSVTPDMLANALLPQFAPSSLNGTLKAAKPSTLWWRKKNPTNSPQP